MRSRTARGVGRWPLVRPRLAQPRSVLSGISPGWPVRWSAHARPRPGSARSSGSGPPSHRGGDRRRLLGGDVRRWLLRRCGRRCRLTRGGGVGCRRGDEGGGRCRGGGAVPRPSGWRRRVARGSVRGRDGGPGSAGERRGGHGRVGARSSAPASGPELRAGGRASVVVAGFGAGAGAATGLGAGAGGSAASRNGAGARLRCAAALDPFVPAGASRGRARRLRRRGSPVRPRPGRPERRTCDRPSRRPGAHRMTGTTTVRTGPMRRIRRNRVSSSSSSFTSPSRRPWGRPGHSVPDERAIRQ